MEFQLIELREQISDTQRKMLTAVWHLIEMGQFWSHSMWFEAPNWNAGIPADIEDLPNDLRACVHERAMSRYDRAVPLSAIPRDMYLQNKKNDISRELS